MICVYMDEVGFMVYSIFCEGVIDVLLVGNVCMVVCQLQLVCIIICEECKILGLFDGDWQGNDVSVMCVDIGVCFYDEVMQVGICFGDCVMFDIIFQVFFYQ